jgi:hypothetical protein
MTDLRHEPVPSGLMNDSLAARIHDPLWFLSRQWQLGEFQADDAGTPARLEVIGATAPVGAYALGNGEWQRYDPQEAPLEPLVEAIGDGADVRLRVEAGAHFLRLLVSHDLAQHRGAFLAACGFASLEPLATDPLLAMAAAVAPDGERLRNELEALIDGRRTLVPIALDDRPAVVETAAEWLAWYAREQGASVAGAGDAWDPHRFEHRIRVASSLAGGVVLRAGDYTGETLGWSEFDIDAAASMPSFNLPPSKAVRLATTPTPVRFGGMPSPRYWEFEDARFNFGNVDAAGYDLGRLLLLQFATLFGNDWFLVPLTLDAGTLTLLDHVIVTDVFGRHFAGRRAVEPEWNLFAQQPTVSLEDMGGGAPPAADDPHPAAGALFLPPTLGPTIDSESLELVHLLRDEMANLAWGVERYYESPVGVRVDRHAAWLGGRTAPVDDGGGDLPRYIVASEVPDYWIPLAPQQLEDHRSIRLVVTPLAVPTDDTFAPAKPLGRLLRADDNGPLWIYEEEVPRAGATVDCIWKYGRWHDGRSFLWKARRKRTGRGEGSSGLRFDVILPE